MASQSTAELWYPYCSKCKNLCKAVVNDYGFDYEGPHGWESFNDDREESRCCNADIIDENPTCTRCDSYLRGAEPVFWTRGSILCADCHSGVPLDS